MNASQMQEWHCLSGAELLDETNYLEDYTVEEIVGLFSCFTNIVVKDEHKINYNRFPENNLKKLLKLNDIKYNKYFK